MGVSSSGRSRGHDFTLSSLSTDVLLAELAKRDSGNERPSCGSGKQGSYDTPLHVFALVLILVLSTLACGFPLISSQSRGGRRQSNIVFYCQHFGTGVLTATAFVHLLPTAFTALTDPCLPYFFSEGYRPLPGLIAMASALIVVSLESYLTTRGAGHSHTHHTEWEEGDASSSEDLGAGLNGQNGATRSMGTRRGSRPKDLALDEVGGDSESRGLMSGISPLPESTPTLQINGKAKSIERDARGEALTDLDDEDDESDVRESMELGLGLDGHGHDHEMRGLSNSTTPKSPGTPHNPSPDERKRLMLQCLLLEAGILFHSVFIGMAISVATGPPFVVFLVAIAFHQTFEGLALGSRIAALHFPRSSLRPWLMVLAYGTTTPLGQAIGLVVHSFYDPQSQTGLLMVGVMNAISSGLLLFAGLVQLLAEDFLTEKSYKTLKGKRRVNAFIAVVGGAMLMAAVGAFA
ncbi:Zinc/iron permease [Coniella lustricola]|uniref:Zinc/iron permease n=1 Tax=Coniella lustricola TaxID=2025994 RepID=A0A2T3A5R2_9PEZI|nr:Zinc/iron permease [Coniella lustricola]